MADEICPFVSRGGLKLAGALDAFALDPAGMVCADLGCNVGGFTDCLLQRGAARVYSMDTGYGILDWKLRNDPRVTVLERTNALYHDPATINGFAGCDLVVIDLGWTRQQRAIPVALNWLKKNDNARIISLIKPQYEAEHDQVATHKHRGVLDDDQAKAVHDRVLTELPVLGVRVLADVISPIRGGASRGRAGNIEYLALLCRA